MWGSGFHRWKLADPGRGAQSCFSGPQMCIVVRVGIRGGLARRV